MKAIIPTGGRGTRMQPLTFSANKHFIPVANKPLIFYPIETVVSAGIKEVGITYNPGYLDQVQSILGNGEKWGAKFTYIIQEKPAGLANIVEVAEEFVNGDYFLLHLGDNIFADGIQELVAYFNNEKPEGLVPMVHHKENTRLGVPYFDDNGRLVKYVEKPQNPPHDFAIPGLYFFSPLIFQSFKGEDRIKPSERGELEISAPYQWLLDHNYRVDVLEYKGKWLDPGKFNDWIEANQYLLDKKLEEKMEGEIDEGSRLENRVGIGQGSRIINSEIRGPVAIGKNVRIENSFIGPFTSISDNCEIEGSRVENSVLMNGVKILNVKHPIDRSLVGADSEIKNGEEHTRTMSLFVGEKCQIQI
ncbi:glucose-1-phosphate thymidylyltransferase [Candidatus Daviesbacteria bacterium]|nr:glucose-1-phosphate thymidylyltransferase [Candidatus Daviesbacteria bacterium]